MAGIAGPARVLSRESILLYELCIAKKWDDAGVLQSRLGRFNEIFAKYNLAACIKTALLAQGFNVGHPILLQSPVSPVARAEIIAALERARSNADDDCVSLDTLKGQRL